MLEYIYFFFVRLSILFLSRLQTLATPASLISKRYILSASFEGSGKVELTVDLLLKKKTLV